MNAFYHLLKLIRNCSFTIILMIALVFLAHILSLYIYIAHIFNILQVIYLPKHNLRNLQYFTSFLFSKTLCCCFLYFSFTNVIKSTLHYCFYLYKKLFLIYLNSEKLVSYSLSLKKFFDNAVLWIC